MQYMGKEVSQPRAHCVGPPKMCKSISCNETYSLWRYKLTHIYFKEGLKRTP